LPAAAGLFALTMVFNLAVVVDVASLFPFTVSGVNDSRRYDSHADNLRVSWFSTGN
jgi:hypothetical protein